MKGPCRIALSGKGGTGKTTISALLIQALIKMGESPVLAVDADPNANLNEALGLPLRETLGSMREDAFTKSIPPGMSRTGYIEYRFQQVLVESEGVDLLAMGRPEGTGCYCFANRLLSEAMDLLARRYRIVVMDMEAGMEHFSRGTIGIPDLLLVVTDPGARGVRTAGRIRDLAITLGIPQGRIFFVVNRAGMAGAGGRIGAAAGSEPLPDPARILASIPDDAEVELADLEARPIVSIPDRSLARLAVKGLAE
ncbi:MAG: AAA family ATPase, partial [Methanomicrobiales archaeon]|nr:AAA family ATPase [Methanomicrobiales archaeon]